MRMTMPDAVKDKVYKWAGVHDLLHFWERDETYFIIIKANNGIYFLRLFPLGGEYALSQDARAEIIRTSTGVQLEISATTKGD